MATFAERQAAERKSLERLSETLDRRAHDLESLMQVLAAARDFSSLDPEEHVQAAMWHYVREKPAQSICAECGNDLPAARAEAGSRQ